MPDDAAIRAASRTAQEQVAAAISTVVALGPDAPSTLREALQTLGSAFNQLGWGDPAVPYGVPRDRDAG